MAAVERPYDRPYARTQENNGSAGVVSDFHFATFQGIGFVAPCHVVGNDISVLAASALASAHLADANALATVR